MNNSQTKNVLVLDNDQLSTRLILETLARKGIRGTLANDKTICDLLYKNDYDLVFAITKIDQPQNGFDIVRKIKLNSPEIPIVMIGFGSDEKNQNHQQTLDVAIKALQAGCCDFLSSPIDAKKLETVLDTSLPNNHITNAESADDGQKKLFTIVGKSAKLAQTISMAKKIATTSAPVLVSGESGTGKELISFLIHHNSKRSQGPYVRVNCAALTDSLLESELFGHEKGAFTGAVTQRKGRFERANGGTLLLDEITETPLKFQAKLLRILEQQDFERVGGDDSIKVNVRIISTTNKDLLQEVTEGRFRQDLYYRLSGLRLVVPSLRQRTDDLPDLVWHFVNLYARQAQRHIVKLDQVMMDIFAKYNWPGNIRQLRNVVLTSLILGTGNTLCLADVSWLFDELQPLQQQNTASLADSQTSAASMAGLALVEVEKQVILGTLDHTNGNQAKAAKILGISDRTLRDKIRRYRQEDTLLPA